MHFASESRSLNAFQLDMLPQTFEQGYATAKQYRGDIQVQLVDQSQGKALPRYFPVQ